MKGILTFFARIPKPSKDQMRVRQFKKEKTNSEYKVKMFKLEVEELKLKMKKLEEQQKDAEENIDKLSKFYDLGIIDKNGELYNEIINLQIIIE